MNNYVQPGATVTLIAPYALSSGAGLLVDTIFGVACDDALISASVEAMTTGVFDLAKTTSQAWTQGQAIYWDNTNQKCTTLSAGNTPIGAALAAAGSSDTTGRVRLNGTADARPVYLQGRLADVSTASVTRIVLPVAGRIDKWWSVLGAAITDADAGLSLTINGDAVTGSGITVANASSAAGDVDSAVPTAANVVAVGDVIGIVTDGASSTAAAAECLIEITT